MPCMFSLFAPARFPTILDHFWDPKSVGNATGTLRRFLPQKRVQTLTWLSWNGKRERRESVQALQARREQKEQQEQREQERENHEEEQGESGKSPPTIETASP